MTPPLDLTSCVQLWKATFCAIALLIHSPIACDVVWFYITSYNRWMMVQFIPLIFIIVFFVLLAVRGVWVRRRLAIS